MNEKNSKFKVTERTFPENLNGKLNSHIIMSKICIMSKNSLGKYEKPSTNSKLYKKRKERITIRNNFVVVFASRFKCINPLSTWAKTGGDICISLVTCSATYKEEHGVADITFDGEWGTRWWQDVDGGTEYEE